MRIVYAIALALSLLSGAPLVSAAPVLDKEPVALTVRKGIVKVANSGKESFEVRVYAITGALVAEFTVEPGAEETIELPSGYYIVKAADTARRVAV